MASPPVSLSDVADRIDAHLRRLRDAGVTLALPPHDTLRVLHRPQAYRVGRRVNVVYDPAGAFASHSLAPTAAQRYLDALDDGYVGVADPAIIGHWRRQKTFSDTPQRPA